MALKNNPVQFNSPFVFNNGTNTKKSLSKFVHAVRLNRPFQALFHLLNTFTSAEDESILILEEDLLEATFRFGELMNLQLKNLDPKNIDIEGLTFMDGYKYRCLMNEVEELANKANSLVDDSSALIFKDLISIAKEFKSLEISTTLLEEAVVQLNDTIKNNSIVVAEFAEELIHSEFFELNEIYVRDLLIYHDMLETIWLNLNSILHLILFEELDMEYEKSEIQWNFENLLSFNLNELFERTIDVKDGGILYEL